MAFLGNAWRLAAAGLLSVLAACGTVETSAGGAEDRVRVTAQLAAPSHDVRPGERQVGETLVRVPALIDGFEEPAVQTLQRADGEKVTLLTYYKAGPLKGTIVGSLTVAVVADAERVAVLGADDQEALRTLIPQSDAPQIVSVGGRSTAWWRQRQVISGTALGLPDRVSQTMEFALGDFAVQVNADGLTEDELKVIVEQIR